jgi:hypothetical protein
MVLVLVNEESRIQLSVRIGGFHSGIGLRLFQAADNELTHTTSQIIRKYISDTDIIRSKRTNGPVAGWLAGVIRSGSIFGRLGECEYERGLILTQIINLHITLPFEASHCMSSLLNVCVHAKTRDPNHCVRFRCSLVVAGTV